MMPDGSTKEDLKIPEGEIGEKLREAFNNGKEVTVQVLSAMGMEQAKSFKEA